MKSCPWQFDSHSIPSVFSQANASLGLVSGAPMVETKSASISWVGFFSVSAEDYRGPRGRGCVASPGILRCEHYGIVESGFPNLFLHLRIQIATGRPPPYA